MTRKKLWFVLGVVVVALALLAALRLSCRLLVDFWWYQALGYSSVFLRILLTKVWLWVVGFALSFGCVASGILLTRGRTGPAPVAFYRWGTMTVQAPLMRRFVHIACWLFAVVVGLVGGGVAAGMWHRVLLLLHATPFGVQDPIFGNDVGFYVFVYPILQVAHPALQVLAWFSLAVSGLIYLSSGAFTVKSVRDFPQPAFRHLARMLGVIMLLSAVGYFLQRYELLYSERGVAFGAGYTDAKARLPGYWIMILASLGVAVVAFATVRPSRIKAFMLVLAGWAGCAILFLGVMPSLVQWARVVPNELDMEKPYIENAISMTRLGYGLKEIRETSYPVVENLSYADVERERDTMSNIRLWDKRPLAQRYAQKQELRSYYNFSNIAVDRYRLDGENRQVMLSVRELQSGKLPKQAQTWVNTRLQYTHGYGLCASPVSEFTEEGYPVFLVKDFPPRGDPGMSIERPQVYYGNLTDDYVFVNTRTNEFDYPMGAKNQYTTYEGKGGVAVSGALSKLFFAWQFHDVKILLSEDLTAGSRILYRRSISERVARLAPYLLLDHDPYAVVSGGRIQWVQDAYTVSGYCPYSDPVRGQGFNYIRNSVKAVVDAYDGTVTLYVADPEDPLIRAYQSIFPALYRPISQMPEDLRAHIRYPRDMFDIQADKYRLYHMQDPRVFYNQEDLWQTPTEEYMGKRPMESYYITMRLPDSDKAEFLLMMPFTPKGRDNMIAWLAARCDGEHYGELVAFMFPKRKVVDGPQQVEGYIDQNSEISRQLTLWSQRGSQVIRGNLLVIPVAGGILYVEPLYIQAEAAPVPQLKRVITAYGEKVAMKATLKESLRALFEQGLEAPPAQRPARPTPGEVKAPAQAGPLVEQALSHYRSAQEALKQADWTQYGAQMQQVEKTLRKLKQALSEEGTRQKEEG
ncbi:MAG: UPF0182 family protein [Planctomycetes bacterium]|nr:UPF0182 family protein [Planctomycetota bacterium]